MVEKSILHKPVCPVEFEGIVRSQFGLFPDDISRSVSPGHQNGCPDICRNIARIGNSHIPLGLSIEGFHDFD